MTDDTRTTTYVLRCECCRLREATKPDRDGTAVFVPTPPGEPFLKTEGGYIVPSETTNDRP